MCCPLPKKSSVEIAVPTVGLQKENPASSSKKPFNFLQTQLKSTKDFVKDFVPLSSNIPSTASKRQAPAVSLIDLEWKSKKSKKMKEKTMNAMDNSSKTPQRSLQALQGLFGGSRGEK